MSAEEVDEYLRGIEEPKRSTLQGLRRTILEIVPDAEQVISYKVPAFRVEGQVFALFVIVLAAAEAAVALAIVLNFYNNHMSVDVDTAEELKG